MKHPHAELLKQLIEDTTLEVEVLVGVNEWGYTTRGHVFHDPSKTSHYRIKPQPIKRPYIKIGTRWVPEPMREEPELHTEVFLITTGNGSVISTKWIGSEFNEFQLENRLLHKTYYAAEQHLAALQELHAQSATLLTDEEARS